MNPQAVLAQFALHAVPNPEPTSPLSTTIAGDSGAEDAAVVHSRSPSRALSHSPSPSLGGEAAANDKNHTLTWAQVAATPTVPLVGAPPPHKLGPADPVDRIRSMDPDSDDNDEEDVEYVYPSVKASPKTTRALIKAVLSRADGGTKGTKARFVSLSPSPTGSDKDGSKENESVHDHDDDMSDNASVIIVCDSDDEDALNEDGTSDEDLDYSEEDECDEDSEMDEDSDMHSDSACEECGEWECECDEEDFGYAYSDDESHHSDMAVDGDEGTKGSIKSATPSKAGSPGLLLSAPAPEDKRPPHIATKKTTLAVELPKFNKPLELPKFNKPVELFNDGTGSRKSVPPTTATPAAQTNANNHNDTVTHKKSVPPSSTTFHPRGVNTARRGSKAPTPSRQFVSKILQNSRLSTPKTLPPVPRANTQSANNAETPSHPTADDDCDCAICRRDKSPDNINIPNLPRLRVFEELTDGLDSKFDALMHQQIGEGLKRRREVIVKDIDRARAKRIKKEKKADKHIIQASAKVKAEEKKVAAARDALANAEEVLRDATEEHFDAVAEMRKIRNEVLMVGDQTAAEIIAAHNEQVGKFAAGFGWNDMDA